MTEKKAMPFFGHHHFFGNTTQVPTLPTVTVPEVNMEEKWYIQTLRTTDLESWPPKL